MNVPDLKLKQSWGVSDITQRLKAATSDSVTQLDVLRELAGISREDEAPSTSDVAKLVFLYLLVNINGGDVK